MFDTAKPRRAWLYVDGRHREATQGVLYGVMRDYHRRMDSLSQIVLGGAVAAAIAPAGHRRAALLA
ncbi:hypothetical protein, partial [Stenotrophomonas sp. 278]|uniref:hypothetical protein n=1 Tax=Stenotrophomonas sp. 278 TaxID=2479851 RepID=UPI0011CEE87E